MGYPPLGKGGKGGFGIQINPIIKALDFQNSRTKMYL